MARDFFSGRNLQQAILAAARRFGIDPAEVAYVERERAGGFIKNPKVVIEVDPAAPRRLAVSVEPAPRVAPPAKAPGPPATAQPRTAAPTRHLEPRPRGDPKAALPHAADALVALVQLGGFDARPQVEVSGDRPELSAELVGPDAPRLAASDGELLEAIEHLAPRVLRGLGVDPVPFRLDAAGFRAAREARLRALALEAAAIVRREGRPHSLPEMPPGERRIVHLTLEDDPAVTTESQGEGFHKVVVVRPA
jgi:spoIIIJ-associated protein